LDIKDCPDPSVECFFKVDWSTMGTFSRNISNIDKNNRNNHLDILTKYFLNKNVYLVQHDLILQICPSTLLVSILPGT
jgi:hypothetical protein